MNKFISSISLLVLISGMILLFFCIKSPQNDNLSEIWKSYQTVFRKAKYVDLTHSFNPTIPVWSGFGNAKFKPAVAAQTLPGYIEKGQEFAYGKQGFIATTYDLPTDQYSTQLDPPAHWDECGATISDIPATYCIDLSS